MNGLLRRGRMLLALPAFLFVASTHAAESGPPSKKPSVVEAAPTSRPDPADMSETATMPRAALAGECAWIGKRVLSLLARDDAQGALDFTQVYELFGCAPEHLPASFACLVQGVTAVKSDSLPERVDRCWQDPSASPDVNDKPQGGEAAPPNATPK